MCFRQWNAQTCANDFREYAEFLKKHQTRVWLLQDEFDLFKPLFDQETKEDNEAIEEEVFHIIMSGIPAIIEKVEASGYKKLCGIFYQA